MVSVREFFALGDLRPSIAGKGSQAPRSSALFIWMWSLARPQTLLENRGRAYAIIWALFSWIFRISIAKSTY